MGAAKKHSCSISRDENAPVAHRLCEQFWTLGPGFARWAESHLGREGHTPQRMRLMAFLFKNGSMKMRDLRDELGVTATSITALVDALEQEKMVVRKAHPKDRRATMIELTKKAEDQLNEFCGPFKDKVSEIFEGFSEREQKEFLGFLERMRDALVERDVLEKTDK